MDDADPDRRGRDVQQVVDGLALMRAFFKITNADDRRKVIELAAALARPGPKGSGASPPIAPR
jgi:hypothetical protein